MDFINMDFTRLIQIAQDVTNTLLDFSKDFIDFLFTKQDLSAILGSGFDDVYGLQLLAGGAITFIIVRIILEITPIA